MLKTSIVQIPLQTQRTQAEGHIVNFKSNPQTQSVLFFSLGLLMIMKHKISPQSSFVHTQDFCHPYLMAFPEGPLS